MGAKHQEICADALLRCREEAFSDPAYRVTVFEDLPLDDERLAVTTRETPHRITSRVRESSKVANAQEVLPFVAFFGS